MTDHRLVDPNPAQTAKVAESFPVARRYRDLDELLAERPAELTDHCHRTVSTPKWRWRVWKRGSHALREAHGALGHRMRSDAPHRRDGLPSTSGRPLPAILPVDHADQRRAERQALGRVQSFRCTWCHAYDWPGKSAFKFQRKDSGGGVPMDHGTHMIDLLLWWLGDAVALQYQDDAMGGVEAVLGVAGDGRGHPGNDSSRIRLVFLGESRFVVECEKGWIAYVNDVVDRIQWKLWPPEPRLNAALLSPCGRLKPGTPFWTALQISCETSSGRP